MTKSYQIFVKNFNYNLEIVFEKSTADIREITLMPISEYDETISCDFDGRWCGDWTSTSMINSCSARENQCDFCALGLGCVFWIFGQNMDF